MLKDGIAAAHLGIQVFESHSFGTVADLVTDWLVANPRCIVHDLSFHTRQEAACAVIVFHPTAVQNR